MSRHGYVFSSVYKQVLLMIFRWAKSDQTGRRRFRKELLFPQVPRGGQRAASVPEAPPGKSRFTPPTPQPPQGSFSGTLCLGKVPRDASDADGGGGHYQHVIISLSVWCMCVCLSLRIPFAQHTSLDASPVPEVYVMCHLGGGGAHSGSTLPCE